MKMMVCFVTRQPQPLQHGFPVSGFVSTKQSEVFIPTPQDTQLPAVCCLKPAQHPQTPTFIPSNPSKQPFPLLTCYKASEDFCLLVEDVHGDVPGGLEVQRVALERDHGCEMGMDAWMTHLELCPAPSPGWGHGWGAPALQQLLPRMDTTALSGPGSALL